MGVQVHVGGVVDGGGEGKVVRGGEADTWQSGEPRGERGGDDTWQIGESRGERGGEDT